MITKNDARPVISSLANLREVSLNELAVLGKETFAKDVRRVLSATAAPKAPFFNSAI